LTNPASHEKTKQVLGLFQAIGLGGAAVVGVYKRAA
jgi:hypothetical protein